MAAWTGGPSDTVATFVQLAVRWRASPQQPLDAATLSDALQYAYALLKTQMASLSPRETSAVLNSLASLRSASPEILRQLAESLLRRPSPPTPRNDPPEYVIIQTSNGAAGAAASPPPTPPLIGSTTAATAAAAPDHSTASQPPPGPAVPGSSAPGLTRLPASEIASVVASLAAFNVRPSDAWLGLCMSSLQLGLPQLSGPQLAQLLWGLVQLGVRPTSPWMALFEESLAAHLQHRHHLHWEQDQAQDPQSDPWVLPQPQLQQQQQQEHGYQSNGKSALVVPQDRRPADRSGAEALSCEDLVRLVRAAAEVGYQPEGRCRALLLAEVRGQLRDMQPHQLAGLAWGVTRLRWRPDEDWRREFLEVTGELLSSLKASDLPPVVAFVAASRLAPPAAWLRCCLAASLAHLPQCSPRDLPDLLANLTALSPHLFHGATPPSPAIAAAPLDATAEAAASSPEQRRQPQRQQAPEQQEGDPGSGEVRALAAAWLDRYLRQCSDKLPRFTAAGVPRMMLAVARTGVEPGAEWRRAACACLASKLDVLGPTDLADAVAALALLPPPPPPSPPPPGPSSPPSPLPTTTTTPATLHQQHQQQPHHLHVPTSSRTQPSRKRSQHQRPPDAPAPFLDTSPLLALLLLRCTTKITLLPGDRLVGLATAAAGLDPRLRPGPRWLLALLEESQARMEASVASAKAAAKKAREQSPGVDSAVSSAAGAAAGTEPMAGAGTVLDEGDGVSERELLAAPRQLSDLLVALAKLQADAAPEAQMAARGEGRGLPKRWLRAFMAVVGVQLAAFDAPSLSGLMWGMAMLDVRLSDGWRERLLARARESLGEGQLGAADEGGAGKGREEREKARGRRGTSGRWKVQSGYTQGPYSKSYGRFVVPRGGKR